MRSLLVCDLSASVPLQVCERWHMLTKALSSVQSAKGLLPQDGETAACHGTDDTPKAGACALEYVYAMRDEPSRCAGAAEACGGATGGHHRERRCGCAHDTRRSWRRSGMPWAICCVFIAGTGSITSGWSWTGGAVFP